MDRRADRHHLIRIDGFVRLLAKELLHRFLHFGDTRGAANQNHFINIAGRQTGVFEGQFTRGNAAFDQIVRHLLELGPAQPHQHVFGAARIRGDKR